MDRKQRASGEQETEALQTKSETGTNRPSEKQHVSLEYAEEVLMQLEFQTLQKITDAEQRAFWIDKLSRVPKWKLTKLVDFTGRLEGVWKFFDELKGVPYDDVSEYLKSLPEPKSPVGKLTCAYLDKIFSDTLSSDQKYAAEREWVKEMKSRNIGVWCVRKNNLAVRA